MQRPLILGANGLVGTALQKVFPSSVTWDREDVDVLDTIRLREKVLQLKGRIGVVINCVAYNDVDGAESNLEIAKALNTTTPGNLAKLAKECGVPLVHFSTGYVFDGEQESYSEDDTPNPLSVYAKTKLAGEREIKKNTEQYYSVRTNVVFGPPASSAQSKQSFVNKVLELSKTLKELKFVDNEVNSITYAPDLADAVFNMLDSKKSFGIYHLVNEGSASWYELGKAVLLDRKDVSIVPIKSSDLVRPAERPKFAVLRNTKLPRLRPWQEALNEYMSSFPRRRESM